MVGGEIIMPILSGKLIASCGHEIKDFEAPNSFSILTKEYDEWDDDSYIKTRYQDIICLECFKEYRKAGIIDSVWDNKKMKWIPIKKYRLPRGK